jgi:hypothetical protein
MRTTARISLCALALLAAGIAGCRDDDRLSYEKDAQEGDVPPIGVQSISVLKSLYHDRTIRITQEISIQGHIVANDTAGEFYKEIVVEDDTGGIVLSIDDERLYRTCRLFDFVTINCQGLALGSEGGTLLLDEVGGLPLNVQAKLLYAIQRDEITPVGASRPLRVDVRLLAVAGPELWEAVEAGRFRQDLYYRLSAFSVELPPLRECREDIYLVANQLMEQICQRYGMEQKTLSGEAFSKLISYDWPGNLRELENVLEGAAALSDSDIIYPEHIHLPTEPAALTLRQYLRQEERRFIQQVLTQCGGDRQKAMQQLDLSRSVFYQRLKEYGLT